LRRRSLRRDDLARTRKPFAHTRRPVWTEQVIGRVGRHAWRYAAPMPVQRSLRGGVAGAVATVVMTLEQPLDKRLFRYDYDDVEVLGKFVTRGDHWRPIGFALHMQNGAVLGAAYAQLKPVLPGPPILRGLLAGLVEHVAVWWPLVELFDRYHPARKELPRLHGRRAFGQATIRHVVYGVVLGYLEDVLNDRSGEPLPAAGPGQPPAAEHAPAGLSSRSAPA
jgi:hypothetical protein